MTRKSSSFFCSPSVLQGLHARFVCIVFLLISCTPAQRVKDPDAETRVKVNDLAKVLEVKGRVLYRNYAEFVFKPVLKGQVLDRYSTVFTDRNGEVTLAYLGAQTAAVSVPPNSIYRLEYQLPISTLLRRGFTRTKRDFLQNKISSDIVSKESEVNVSGVQDTGEFKDDGQKENQQTSKAVRFGLRMAFEMKKIPIIFPSSNIYIWNDPKTRRASLPIVFGGENSEAIQAYLWQLRPESRIVWSGLVSKTSRRITLTIEKPGTYLFQGFGQSGTSRTRSVRIVVVERNSVTDLFPQGAIAGDTVLFN